MQSNGKFSGTTTAIYWAILCAIAISARADTITVTNTNDSGPGSLRQALTDTTDGDTIDFDRALDGQAITLTSGELLINKNIAISGPGANFLAVSRDTQAAGFRIFHVTRAHIVMIEGLEISNGRVGGQVGDFGGGILNEESTLTVNNCVLAGNSSTSNAGGGIFSNGSGAGGAASLTIARSTFSGNTAATSGGAVFDDGANSGMASLAVSDSTFNNNTAGALGGGIYNDSTGGGLSFVTITNCTFNQNALGIFNESEEDGRTAFRITHSTFSENTGASVFDFVGVMEIGNTILSSASDPTIGVFKGTVVTLGYNLSSDDGGGFLNGDGDQINTDPLLGPLQDNGGPTFTHALLPDSPAINSGDPNFTPPPFNDQRGPGFDRVVTGRLDIGAFEMQGSTPTPSPTPTPTATVTPTLTPTPTTTPRPTPTPRARPAPRPRPIPRP